jgi:hypothetical protein
MAQLSGQLVYGTTNGIVVGSIRQTSPTFIPLFIGGKTTTAGGASPRAAAWRGRMIECAGGVVFGTNVNSNDSSTDCPSFLLWYGQGGVIKVLDANVGSIGDIEIFDGKLYYGAGSFYDNGVFTNYRMDNPQLASFPLDQIRTRVVPYKDVIAGNATSLAYVAGTTGEGGSLGGWPTFGYTKGRLRIEAGTSGTLTIAEAGTSQQGTGYRVLATVAVTGGAHCLINLAAMTAQGGTLTVVEGDTCLTGNPLVISYSVSSTLKAEVYFQ